MNSFIKRNIKLYFKDKGAVFFSLLSVVIIITLYAVFLGDSLLSEMEGFPKAKEIMNAWLAAGIIAVTSITTTTGAFGTMVLDRVNKKAGDFYTSPLKRGAITGGYLTANFVIGVLMSIVAFVILEVYLVASGGSVLPFFSICKVLGLIVLSVFSNTALVCFVVSFFKSNNAYTGASIILGTLVGFLTGIYLPIGQLADGVQWAVKLFPVSHSAVLFRQVMMEPTLDTAFSGAPDSLRATLETELGVTFSFDGFVMKPWMHIAVVVITGVFFYLLALWNMRRAKQK